MIKRLSTGETILPPFIFGGVQYPDNFGECLSAAELKALDLAYTPAAVVPTPSAGSPKSNEAPDNPTLGDWRVGLLLWRRLDDVTEKIETACAAGDPFGFVAKQRFEYSNNVLRRELISMKDALGFTAADVDESLWRADRVAKGDLSGTWPLAN